MACNASLESTVSFTLVFLANKLFLTFFYRYLIWTWIMMTGVGTIVRKVLIGQTALCLLFHLLCDRRSLFLLCWVKWIFVNEEYDRIISCITCCLFSTISFVLAFGWALIGGQDLLL